MSIVESIEFICVEDGLPDAGESVLRFGYSFPDAEPTYDVGQLITSEGHRWADWGVTHWARLPHDPIGKPPKWSWRGLSPEGSE